MVDTPRQDWDSYRAKAAPNEAAWIRGLSAEDRFALYEDLYGIISEGRRGPGNWQRLERWNWQQKLAMRLWMVDAFCKRDQIARARTAAKDVG